MFCCPAFRLEQPERDMATSSCEPTGEQLIGWTVFTTMNDDMRPFRGYDLDLTATTTAAEVHGGPKPLDHEGQIEEVGHDGWRCKSVPADARALNVGANLCR